MMINLNLFNLLNNNDDNKIVDVDIDIDDDDSDDDDS